LVLALCWHSRQCRYRLTFLARVFSTSAWRKAHFESSDLSNTTFRSINLTGATLTSCNLSGAEISASNLSGMKIDGVLVTDLQKAYQDAKRK
jgi:uncharacterized protein YjbI with pentapeptide repeats